MLKLSRIPRGSNANRTLKRNEEGGVKGGAPPEETVVVEEAFKRFWKDRSWRQQEQGETKSEEQ